MKKLIFLNIIAAMLYSGCSGVPVPRLPQRHSFEIKVPDSSLFPVGSKYDKVLKGTLKGHGRDFEDSARKNSIPVSLLISISMWETGNGSSQISKKYNNISGSFRRGKPMRFRNVAESIDYTARNLKKNYFDKGLTSLVKIKTKYAPGGGRNSGWIIGVKKMMKSLPK